MEFHFRSNLRKWYHVKMIKLLFLLALTASCTTARKWDGKDPNLNHTGEAARQELDNYTFKEDGLLTQRSGYRMGPLETLYTLESLAPMMKRVAPQQVDKIETIQRSLKVNKMVGWTSLALLVAGSMLQDDLQVTLMGVGGFGALWWAGRDTWLRWQLTTLSPGYNDELANRFAPRFSWNKQF